MFRIFLISRYDETVDLRDRIADQMRERYGANSVVAGLTAPSLPEYLRLAQRWMGRCHVAVVVIGPGWEQAHDAFGRRLIDNPYDPVRVEVREALAQRRLVVPLLLHGATMPRSGELPPDIAPLALRQGSRVRNDPEFAGDLRAIYSQINTQLTWRPASLFVLCAAAGSGLALVTSYATADLTFGVGAQSAFGALIFIAFLVALLIVLTAGAAGILLSVVRRGWGWLITVCAGLLLLTVVASVPTDGSQAEASQLLYLFPLILLNVLILGAFGLFGPRRETTGA
ncbi:MAG TPA: hypothetical protein VF808_16580 [Ktedonobacterales bacterium]